MLKAYFLQKDDMLIHLSCKMVILDSASNLLSYAILSFEVVLRCNILDLEMSC